MKKTIHIALLTTMVTIGLSNLAFAQDAKTTTPAPTPAVTTPAAAAPATTPVAATPATTAPVTTAQPAVVTAAPAQPAVAEAASFTPAQIDQLHTVIHDYLVKNPQVLVEASRALQAQQEKQMQAAAMSAIEQNKNALFNDASSPTMGNKNAPVILVEFFDYQCGHCRAMAPTIKKLISEDKNIHIIFKELPIFGGMSDYAAKAALAAAMQHEKYYAFHNSLLSSTASLTKENIMAIAKKEDLNIAQLKRDMELPTIQKQLSDNMKLAQALKVMGTPTFVVANQAQTKFSYIPGATTLADLQTRIKSVE